MEFNQSEFEKNLLRKANGPQGGNPSDRKIDVDSIHIKDADDVPINTYEGETPRDRAAKLAAWEAQGERLLSLTDGYALWCGHGNGRMDRALLDALHAELDALDPEGKRICELLMKCSEREAADQMGLSRSAFKRRWAKVKTSLADRLRDIYE